MKVYVVKRADEWEYDCPIEQTIVAKNKERALEIAIQKAGGEWEIEKEVDLEKEQILTIDKNQG